ncbi:tyrosine-type recombinase/integrase [Cohnella sp.]|uniref:tyrosine-type recombinase/integrase n=1 Tax=Cohnella sp. TaxID=1883426 RepID=UPI003565FF29
MTYIIEEVQSSNGISFIKWFKKTDGSLIEHIKVNIQTVKVPCELTDKISYILYDPTKKPISSAFQYLNYEISELSPNSIEVAMIALKLLYSFLLLNNVDIHSISMENIRQLKNFLYGVNHEGYDLVFKNLTKRNSDTLNMYFGVYRKYLKYLSIKESAFYSKTINSNSKSNSGFLAHAKRVQQEKYNISERATPESTVVPMYISVADFKKILKVIRGQYSLREEIIVRLMFECGARIGEVLGLTLEDIEVHSKTINIEGNDQDSFGTIVIRNRVSDKDYQLAKTCFTPKNKEDYSHKIYLTEKKGFQNIYPSIDLIERIEQYIEQTHGRMSKTKRANYLSSARADNVTNLDSVESEDNYYIFLNKNGTSLSIDGWNKVLRGIFTKCGLKIDRNVRRNNLSHRFRHGYAMFLIKYQNASHLDVMHALRQTSLQSVLYYFRPTIEDKYKANQDSTNYMHRIIPELKEG